LSWRLRAFRNASVATHLHRLLVSLVDGRMKACEQWRLVPAVRRDLGKHVSVCEAMREQSVEKWVKFRVCEALRLPTIHAPDWHRQRRIINSRS